jgi:hypothetical protein
MYNFLKPQPEGTLRRRRDGRQRVDDDPGAGMGAAPCGSVNPLTSGPTALSDIQQIFKRPTSKIEKGIFLASKNLDKF